MKGYWGREDATAEVMKGGWFHTGDMATVDEDGYFFIVDRKKDMIIRGGYNVYPREIEEVLYEHPAVSEVAVIGVPGRLAGRGGRAPRSCSRRARRRPRDDIRALRQGARRGVQVPAQDLVPGRAPEGPDGQDPQARDQGRRRRSSKRRRGDSGLARRYAEHLFVRARTLSLVLSDSGGDSSPRAGPSAWAQERAHAVAGGAVGGLPARPRGRRRALSAGPGRRARILAARSRRRARQRRPTTTACR